MFSRRCARADELAKDDCYNRRSKVEASISRHKRVIGDTLKSRDDARRVTEVAIAFKSLKCLDDDIINAIARQDKKGRRLLVVTTDLDAQRAVIWDMGAIATIGGPKAFKLFRDVLAASGQCYT